MKEYVARTPRQIGAILRGFRKSRGMTQAQTGDAIGLPQSVVSKLEADPSNAAFSRVFKLLAALELELAVRPRGTPPPPSEW